MKLGIKYCGGCNPRYDRTAVVSKLKDDISADDVIEVAKEESIYDIVIILCGCTSCCASHERFKAKYGKVILKSEDDYSNIIYMINKVKNS